MELYVAGRCSFVYVSVTYFSYNTIQPVVSSIIHLPGLPSDPHKTVYLLDSAGKQDNGYQIESKSEKHLCRGKVIHFLNPPHYPRNPEKKGHPHNGKGYAPY